MKKTIKNEEFYDLFNIKNCNFPKYTTQLLNLANQNSQGTRPKVVGQLSDLIQEFDGNTFEEWIKWYKEKHPEAIDNALVRVKEMISNLKSAIKLIDE